MKTLLELKTARDKGVELRGQAFTMIDTADGEIKAAGKGFGNPDSKSLFVEPFILAGDIGLSIASCSPMPDSKRLCSVELDVGQGQELLDYLAGLFGVKVVGGPGSGVRVSGSGWGKTKARKDGD